MKKPFLMGAVAYAPKVITIWEGFRAWFDQQGFAFDYVLYSNYERQVEAQFAGEIDLAWNSPLAHVRAERIAKATGKSIDFVAMRDTDCDLASFLVVRANAPIRSLDDLRGKKIGFGAIDSPQASLIPRDHLRQHGLIAGRDFTAVRFDRLAGKHGDHIGGERDAAVALMQGEIDASWMIDGNYHAFAKEAVLPAGAARILAQTELYDHCIFTLSPQADHAQTAEFKRLLLSMSWHDADVRSLFELEGLKAWREGRTSGYRLLRHAVDEEGFYSPAGEVLERDYRY